MNNHATHFKQKMMKASNRVARFVRDNRLNYDLEKTDFEYRINVLLKNKLSHPVDCANVIKKLQIMLNREIFTRNELRRNMEIMFFASLEKAKTSPHYHILIKVPDCKRSLGATEKDSFIKKCVFNVLECLNIVDLRTLDPNRTKTFQPLYDSARAVEYNIKEDPQKLSNIDFANIRLETLSQAPA
jgi:hypothetical protein